MNIRTLRALLKARGWRQSDLARRVGVSRQAVSLWFRQREQAILRSDHLLRAAEALGVPPEEIAQPLPCMGVERNRLRATLLWDNLYPDLDDLAIALDRGDPRAVARLVEVHGLYAAEKVVGRRVWKRFPRFKRHLHPARRRVLEALHRWHERRTGRARARIRSDRKNQPVPQIGELVKRLRGRDR